MKQPASVTRLIASQVVLAVLGLVTVVLVVVLRDDLVRSWAEGRSPQVRETLRVGGLEALEKSGVDAPAFVPPALVLFVVVAALIWVLVEFVRLGYAWSRIVLTGLLVFSAVATVAGIRTGPPAVFVVLGAVSFAIEAVSLVFLWHRDTTAYLEDVDVDRDTAAAH